jgi:hypothetical protein
VSAGGSGAFSARAREPVKAASVACALVAPEQFQTAEAVVQAAFAGDVLAARDAAKDDALRNCVQQVATTIVTAATETDQAQLLSDKVCAHATQSVGVKVHGGSVAVAAGALPRRDHGARDGAEKAGRKPIAGLKEVTREAWERIVTSMMMELRVASDGTASEPRGFALAAPGADEWERWNRARDALGGGQGDGAGPAR